MTIFVPYVLVARFTAAPARQRIVTANGHLRTVLSERVNAQDAPEGEGMKRALLCIAAIIYLVICMYLGVLLAAVVRAQLSA